MTLASRGFLALAAVVEIALGGRAQPFSSRQLAERLALPPRQLEPLLQTLVRQGVLKSVRGPHGGYALARERRRIRASDIVSAVLQESPPADGPADRLVAPERRAAEAAFMQALEGQTIEGMCRRALSGESPTAPSVSTHFTI